MPLRGILILFSLLAVLRPSVIWPSHSAPKVVLLGQNEDPFRNWDFTVYLRTL